MRFLLDASSVMKVIRDFTEEKALKILKENCVLDLTKYEVGNALWTEHALRRAMKEDQFVELLNLCAEILSASQTVALDLRQMVDAAMLGAKEKVTVYDASYIMAAKGRRLTLITEDGKLRTVASKHVRSVGAAEIKP